MIHIKTNANDYSIINRLILYLLLKKKSYIYISILLVFKGLPLFGFLIFLAQKYPYTFMFK